MISKTIFPNLYKLFQAARTTPKSSSDCERDFLATRLIKTWSRTFMSQERFTSTSILYSQKRIQQLIYVFITCTH